MSITDYLTASPQPLGTVFVVDDDEAVRDSIRWLLESSNYKVELFDSGESFMTYYQPDQVGVLLLDVRMNGMSGLEVQDHLIARKSDLPIIMLAAYGDVQMAVTALKKPFDHAALRQLVEKMLVEAVRRRSQNERELIGRQKMAKLTPRERQVLERIVSGRLNKQIADDLGISIKTVEAHRASIMDKTASGTVADLMRVVMDSGERL